MNPKKGKIRVVFDCNSLYQGNSINQNLLSGPDFIRRRYLISDKIIYYISGGRKVI